MVSTEFLMDLDSYILGEILTEYGRQGLALKRHNPNGHIMTMKLELLRKKRNFPHMEAGVFTSFLEKYYYGNTRKIPNCLTQ